MVMVVSVVAAVIMSTAMIATPTPTPQIAAAVTSHHAPTATAASARPAENGKQVPAIAIAVE